jgi:pyroglutamyl-peptidase
MPINSVCILVTGFGCFPGAPKNPTSALIRRLEQHKSRLARQGIRLELSILPVLHAALPELLHQLNESFKPDIILHFGLAAKRKSLTIEARAKNRLGLLHPDASGARAKDFRVLPDGAPILQSRFPTSTLKAQLNRAGFKAHCSIDAGDYICNQTFYLSLASPIRAVGFIHVPKLRHLDLNGLERMALLTIGLSIKALRY